MKKYSTLGEILIDFRNRNGLSQIDLASKFDIDVRTVSRWERNETLLRPEKEEEMADITFIPHQVIRNLNTSYPIPTYYDFDLRKYSLSSISRELPEANWIKVKIDKTTERLRTIDSEKDIESIIRFIKLQKNPQKAINKSLIMEATKIFPTLNLFITDTYGNYAGHCVYFPISTETYQKIKNKTMLENELTVAHLVDYKTEKTPVFYCHSITADCNENFFFIIGEVLMFFRDTPLKNYIYALLTSRYDSYGMSEQLGVKMIWEDKKAQQELGMLAPPRLYEGNFKKFLNQ
jgi:transcriptional regulator with XRE-family HTH domain